MYMDEVNLQEKMNNQAEAPMIGRFRFWVDPVRNLDTGKIEEIEYVEWTKLGDRYDPKTVEKVSRLKGNPGRNRPPAPEWVVIEPHYKAWKEGVEKASDGTALEDWRGVDKNLVAILKAEGVYTVEEFAAYSEHHVTRFKHPNIHKWHKLAKDYVKDSAGREALKAELDSRDEMIAELMKRLEAVEAAKTDEAPKKRGRPPKAEKVDEGEQAA